MKKVLVAFTAAAALALPASASAQVYTTPVCGEPVGLCDVGEAADAVVGLVVHALWPTLRHVDPLVQSILP